MNSPNNEPDMSADKIFIRQLVFDAILGILPAEREQPQTVTVDITVFTNTQPAAKSQDIADTLNYADLAEQVMELTVDGKYLLIETLVEDLAALCLRQPHAGAVKIRVEKPQAVAAAHAVGVEIYRQQAALP